MTTISQGNKKITTRKIPAMNNKVLVHTGSLRFFKKYRQPISLFHDEQPLCQKLFN